MSKEIDTGITYLKLSEAVDSRDDLKFYAKAAIRPSFYIAGQVELTTACHSNCTFCAKASKVKRWPTPMPYEMMCRLYIELYQNPWFENLTLTGGDPQAWPHLDRFLKYVVSFHKHMQSRRKILNINTTLQKPISEEQAKLWADSLNSVRVSLDGTDSDILQKTRGVRYQFDAIAASMHRLHNAGVSVSTNTCVSELNIDHILDMLSDFRYHIPFIRKAMFLPYLGCSETLNEKWRKVIKMAESYALKPPFPTSLAENPVYVRDAINLGLLDKIPCWASRIGFHMKPDGSVYRCCLTGGEAVEADDSYKVGTYDDVCTMESIYENLGDIPPCLYNTARCIEICQFKQTALNMLCNKAFRVEMRLP